MNIYIVLNNIQLFDELSISKEILNSW